jgi:hypothetical protein
MKNGALLKPIPQPVTVTLNRLLESVSIGLLQTILNFDSKQLLGVSQRSVVVRFRLLPEYFTIPRLSSNFINSQEFIGQSAWRDCAQFGREESK